MKNRNLNMLVRASVASRKLSTGFYCFFVMISAVLILLSVGIILPLGGNIVNNINNHISNRELVTDFADTTTQEYIDSTVSKIRQSEHVTEVYRRPARLTVTEESGELSDSHTLGFVHNGFNLKITSGRAFDESETGVAVVPQTIRDFNPGDNKIHEIAGEDLVGKTLVLTDICGNSCKVKVVGAYNTSDPIFSGDEILVSRADLLKYDQALLDSAKGFSPISKGQSYIILIDSPENLENTAKEISHIKEAYQSKVDLDADSYNIAFIILLASLIFFIILVITGFFMFLKNSVNSRTNELALYRSLGYKSKHLFSIIFTEHLIFGILSIALGTALSAVLSYFLVNPYLFTLTGNTIMEMTVSISALQVICILIFFIAILIVVCRSAVKRSEKIDLTVLLRER